MCSNQQTGKKKNIFFSMELNKIQTHPMPFNAYPHELFWSEEWVFMISLQRVDIWVSVYHVVLLPAETLTGLFPSLQWPWRKVIVTIYMVKFLSWVCLSKSACCQWQRFTPNWFDKSSFPSIRNKDIILERTFMITQVNSILSFVVFLV